MHSEVPVEPTHRDRALDLLKELAERSREEPGVIQYRVTVDVVDRDTFRIFEQYEDEEAAEAHETSDHLAEFLNKFDGCLAQDSELRVFEVTNERRVEGP